MEKFNRVMRGYDPIEVNTFIDNIINRVETMVGELKTKEEEIKRLKLVEQEYNRMKEKVLQYEKTEETLKRAILMAERTSEQIKLTAHKEREVLISDAKNNANRIINAALLKADQIDRESQMIKHNTTIFKRRLREVLETQMDLVEDIEKIEL